MSAAIAGKIARMPKNATPAAMIDDNDSELDASSRGADRVLNQEEIDNLLGFNVLELYGDARVLGQLLDDLLQVPKPCRDGAQQPHHEAADELGRVVGSALVEQRQQAFGGDRRVPHAVFLRRMGTVFLTGRTADLAPDQDRRERR